MIASLLAAIGSFVVLAITFGPLERAFPARPGQKFFRAAWLVDGTFFLGQYLVWTAVAVSFLAWARSALGDSIVDRVAITLASVPMWTRGIAAIVLGDVLVYWFHRACHRFEWLWRFHAVHHSAEHLDWLAAHREHPVDGVSTQLLQNLPSFLLGFPIEAVGGLIAFRGLWAIFVHSNVRIPLGPLRWVFGAPELHHWHHARVARTEHNFANLAPWLDLLFGTHHVPEGPEAYALGLDEPWPKGYLAQLVHPFRNQASATATPKADDALTMPGEPSRTI